VLSIFFIPGYMFLAALYPNEEKLDQSQRVLGSVGFSIVIVGMIELPVAYIGGINQTSSFLILIAWVGLMFLIAYRRRGKNNSESYTFSFSFRLLSWGDNTPSQKRILFAEAIVLVCLLLTGARLFWTSSQAQPQFTEFYILGANGQAADYGDTITVGEEVNVTVGIKNHGDASVEYKLYYQIDTKLEIALASVSLAPDELWESPVSILVLERAGVHKVKFVLRSEKTNMIEDELYLWIEVGSKP
jgi:uncharacterized membrane protein